MVSSTVSDGKMLATWNARPMPWRTISGGERPADVDAVEQDRPESGPQRAGDQIEERALAGAVGADHGGERTVGKVERDIVGRLDAAEGFREADA